MSTQKATHPQTTAMSEPLERGDELSLCISFPDNGTSDLDSGISASTTAGLMGCMVCCPVVAGCLSLLIDISVLIFAVVGKRPVEFM